MNRAIWTESITEERAPAWPCPTCRTGTLSLVRNSLVSKETANSRQTYDVLSEPELIGSTFSAWLKCNYGTCGDAVAVAGIGKVAVREKTTDEEIEESIEDLPPHPSYEAIYQPLFCCPMPDMFEVSENCPGEVVLELRAAFRLFWANQAASAGRVRVALERLMDHYNIPSGKLHRRIKQFSNAQATVGGRLMALKWLGNTALHEGHVSREDLLDAFEILEFVMAQLFDQKDSRIAELARQLDFKHNPEQHSA